MKEFKTAMIASCVLILLGTAGAAIWYVRAYLPLLGVFVLGALIIAILLALFLGVEFVYRRFTRYTYHAIDEHGTIAQRHRGLQQIAPYYATAARAATAVESTIEEVEDQPEEKTIAAPLLTFKELLLQGWIQAALDRGEIILGYNALTRQLRYGSWLDLYSCGVGGVSGTGKSTTTRFLLFQAALAGAHFIFIDPHIGDPEESLAAQFAQLPGNIHQFRPCDGNTANIIKRVKWLSRELARRKLGKIKTPFLIFVIDEFNEQMRNKEIRPELSELLLNIEQGGRKFGIFAMLIGQRWSQQDLGGADIRTSLSSKLAHRFSDEDQAKRFFGSKHGPTLLELETGYWKFADTHGKVTDMITPATYSDDGRYIADLIVESTAETTVKPRENTEDLPEITDGKILQIAPRNQAETTPESSDESTEMQRLEQLARAILAMQADGKSKNEIMRTLWGVNPGASEAYTRAQAEYVEVIRYIAEQIGA